MSKRRPKKTYHGGPEVRVYPKKQRTKPGLRQSGDKRNKHGKVKILVREGTPVSARGSQALSKATADLGPQYRGLPVEPTDWQSLLAEEERI